MASLEIETDSLVLQEWHSDKSTVCPKSYHQAKLWHHQATCWSLDKLPDANLPVNVPQLDLQCKYNGVQHGQSDQNTNYRRSASLYRFPVQSYEHEAAVQSICHFESGRV
ncbi:TPA: hypothetical protein ACH3X1_003416 [Trebouxia sp. C0004]